MKEYSFVDKDLFTHKTPWDKLSIAEQAAMMKAAVSEGVYDLKDIRQKYNEFAGGGDLPQTDWSYDGWKRQIAAHKGINVDKDNTYDYESFFREHPRMAWGILNDAPDAHFPDTYKTAYHPTFSTQSQYSGQYHPQYNPQALKGGKWNKEGTIFTMSPDGYRGHVNMDDRKWYLENAEDFGVQLREANGSLPVYDSIPWAGVLPTVTITAKKKSFGGELRGPLVEAAMRNIYGDGGSEEITAYTPIAKPVIPKVEGDQQAVNWLANWYNNRRKQLYNNISDYDGSQTFLYDLKDKLTGNPVGRRAINHDYYNKLNRMTRYKTADFEDLERDNTASYDELSGNVFGITVPEAGKIYYDNNLIQDATRLQNKQEGYSPLGIHIHERTHSSGDTGSDGKFTGYNAQTAALEKIIKHKDTTVPDPYLDASPEIYARMMEFRYNHHLNPKKKYTKTEIQKFLNEENKGYKSDLQRYTIESLTKALNEVAQVNSPTDFFNYYT